MLAWSTALPCILLAGLSHAALRTSIEGTLPEDVLMAIMLKLDFANLCQASYLAKSFRTRGKQAILALYSTRYGNENFLNYTAILHELDALVQDTGESLGIVEAKKVLKASPHFLCIQRILEAEFGCCIRHGETQLPQFYYLDLVLDIIHHKRKALVLPYVLDQMSDRQLCLIVMEGLVEIGRFDLLAQLKFLKIDTAYFYLLMVISVPKSLVQTAAQCLQENEPKSKLAELLALAKCEDQASPWPEDWQVPLFLLCDLHEKNVPIPEKCVFINGLYEESIRFWMYMLGKGIDDATTLQGFVLKHGSNSTRQLARVFGEQVSTNGMSHSKKAMYQAMLIRFRFSNICNAHVIQNYASMVEEPLVLSYHTIRALLDCKQYELADRFEVANITEADLEALIDRMYRLKDGNFDPLIIKCVRHLFGAPKLLKCLLQRKAGNPHTQLVWESIISTRWHRSAEHDYCTVPLAMLEKLVFDPEISTSDVSSMFDKVYESEGHLAKMPKEAYALYAAMFWEAPERVITHFLDLVSQEFKLEFGPIWRLLLLAKYSAELCVRLVQRLKPQSSDRKRRLLKFNPYLDEECGSS